MPKPGELVYEKLREMTGLPKGTDADVVFGAYKAMWAKRAAAVGLPADSTIPDILAAQRKARDADKLSAALRAAGGVAAGAGVGGVRLLSREEAQEVQLFGLDTPLTRRRVQATEDALGKDLRSALRDGDLR